MASKNIAFIVKYFPTVSQTFIVNQINALIDKGYTVALFSYRKTDDVIIHNSLKKHQLLEKVNYFVTPSSSKIKRLTTAFSWVIKHSKSIKWSLLFKTLNFFKYGKEAYTLKLFYEMQWFLIENEIDIIHTHFGENAKRIAHLKKIGLLSTRLKLVTTFHGYDLLPSKETYYRLYYKNVFQYSDAITVNTQYMNSLLNKIDAKLDCIFILPVGLDTTYFKPEPKQTTNDAFQIVFCGNLIPLKGADIAVKIVKQLNKKGHDAIKLKIIGNGTMFSEIETLVNDLELTDKVDMCGALRQEKIKDIFNQSDVFLLPGRLDPVTKRAETQGLVIQEAQAMQLPVVVSDVGGMKYGLIHDKTGFVIKENDIDGFASCIASLVKDNGLKQELGKQGRLYVVENYDTRVLVEKLERIYQDISN